MSVPRLTEVFVISEAGGDSVGEFRRRVKALASKNKGKIPLTHATNEQNWKQIQSSGMIRGGESSGGNERAGVGVFMHLGFLESSDWGSSSGGHRSDRILLFIELPLSELENIEPDQNLFGGKHSDEVKTYGDFLRSARNQGRQDLVGMEVFRPGDIPAKYVGGVKSL